MAKHEDNRKRAHWKGTTHRQHFLSQFKQERTFGSPAPQNQLEVPQESFETKSFGIGDLCAELWLASSMWDSGGFGIAQILEW